MINFHPKMQLEKLSYLASTLSNVILISECIFTINKAQSLNESTEIVKDRVNLIINTFMHNKINRFSEQNYQTKTSLTMPT